MKAVCYCRQDRGVLCVYHLTASRLRIIARDFEARENFELAVRVRDLSEAIEKEAVNVCLKHEDRKSHHA